MCLSDLSPGRADPPYGMERRRRRDFDSVNQGVFKRMRRGRKDGARVRLPFDDIMEFAIALLSISPQELEALRWTFADRKRLLDHLLASGRAAQGVDPERLGMLPIEISIPRRSEEHTSELQSLMRISYAVFCLKKKK